VLIFTGSQDHTAKLFDLITGVCIKTFENKSPVNSVSFSNNNR